jgi:hypothetical protein
LTVKSSHISARNPVLQGGAVACEEGEIVTPSVHLYRKRHVARGDYQQTSGATLDRIEGAIRPVARIAPLMP